jgi:hypothetical protein
MIAIDRCDGSSFESSSKEIVTAKGRGKNPKPAEEVVIAKGSGGRGRGKNTEPKEVLKEAKGQGKNTKQEASKKRKSTETKSTRSKKKCKAPTKAVQDYGEDDVTVQQDYEAEPQESQVHSTESLSGEEESVDHEDRVDSVANDEEDEEYGDAFAYKEPVQPSEPSQGPAGPPVESNKLVKKARARQFVPRKPRKKIVVTEVFEDFNSLTFDSDVAEFINSSLLVPEKIKELRMKELVVTVRLRTGIVEQPIPTIQKCILQVLFWVLLTEGFFCYNPIEKTLRYLSTKSFFVVGKSFINASLFKYLFASASLRFTYQKVHENIKRSLSIPISRIPYPDATGILTTWMTSDHIEVLECAIDKWSPINTFRVQQLADKGDSYVPQTILELLIRSFKMCADMEFEDTFLQSTSPALEAFVLGLLYETFKRRGLKESLKSMGKSSASVGKVVVR